VKRSMRRSARKANLPPGSLIHTGDSRGKAPEVDALLYGPEVCESRHPKDPHKLPEVPENGVLWVTVTGVDDAAVLEAVGQRFGLHPLVLEDVMNVVERPKLEDFGDYIFLVLKILSYDDVNDELLTQQVSLVLGRGWVVSFLEHEHPLVDNIRQRIESGVGRFRQAGADYLAYALIDIIVDQFFVVLEMVEDDMERLEEEVVENPGPDMLQRIHRLKNAMVVLRKAVWPLREVLGVLERGETPLVQERTQVYMRDVYDHTIQIIDTVETFRDILSGLVDIHLSSVSNRLNEVMKVLTIIATVFMPLSFFAGVYGMNFKHFPEVEWAYGYPAFWVICAVTVGLMLRYFRRKRWL
jgi:magnesium transporter